jgi:hypothetical protein
VVRAAHRGFASRANGNHRKSRKPRFVVGIAQALVWDRSGSSGRSFVLEVPRRRVFDPAATVPKAPTFESCSYAGAAGKLAQS